MLYGSIRRNLYAHLSIHKMRWTLVFDYLFTPISTPKWHESIWFCMKFYEFTISKNFVTMRFYGLLLMYIDLWKKANLQQFLISFVLILLRFSLIFKGFQRLAPWLLHHFYTISAWTYMLGNPAWFKLPHSLIQGFRCDMDVSVHRCFYTCVTKQLLQHFGLYAAFNRSCGVGMA